MVVVEEEQLIKLYYQSYCRARRNHAELAHGITAGHVGSPLTEGPARRPLTIPEQQKMIALPLSLAHLITCSFVS